MVATLHNKKPHLVFDEILNRYLSDIENEYDRAKQNNWNRDSIAGKDKFLIKRFLEYENITHDTEKRFEAFRNYFEKNGILKFYSYSDYWYKYFGNSDTIPIRFVELRDPYEEIEFEPFLVVKVLKINELRKIRKNNLLQTNSETARNLISDNKRYLYMNESYQFFQGKERKEVSLTMSRDTQYFKILVAIYLVTNGSGDATVAQVDKVLRSKLNFKEIPRECLKKKIENSINLSYPKHMSTQLPSGEKLFSWVRRSNPPRLIFSNPIFD